MPETKSHGPTLIPGLQIRPPRPALYPGPVISSFSIRFLLATFAVDGPSRSGRAERALASYFGKSRLKTGCARNVFGSTVQTWLTWGVVEIVLRSGVPPCSA